MWCYVCVSVCIVVGVYMYVCITCVGGVMCEIICLGRYVCLCIYGAVLVRA